MLSKKLLISAALVLYASSAYPAQEPPSIEAAWLQLVPGPGTRPSEPHYVIRAVIKGTDARCPKAILRPSRRTHSLIPKSNPFEGEFPITLCEAKFHPGDNTTVSLQRFQWTIPGSGFDHILLLGDTGCRGKEQAKKEDIQPCEDDTWPFERIADHAAKYRADLVIHVGDYMYGRAGQRDNFASDSWENWKREFFDPANKSLSSALESQSSVPWLMVRGNHEACNWRSDKHPGHRGWHLLLEHIAFGSTLGCADGELEMRDPYAIDIGEDHRLVIVDSSDVYKYMEYYRETGRHHNDIEILKLRLNELTRNAKNVWLVTHVPPWGIETTRSNSVQETEYAHTFKSESVYLQSILSDVVDKGNVTTVISGDLHYAQIVDTGVVRPVQIIAGNGGVALDLTQEKLSVEALRPTVRGRYGGATMARTFSRFGFIQACKQGGEHWEFELITPDSGLEGGEEQTKAFAPSLPCRLAEGSKVCEPIRSAACAKPRNVER